MDNELFKYYCQQCGTEVLFDYGTYYCSDCMAELTKENIYTELRGE